MMSHKENTADDVDYSQKNLTSDESKEIFKQLGNSQCKILRFLGNNATRHAIPGLVSAIQENQHLSEVYLGDNNIGDEGANMLANCLKHNASLKLLDINSNNINDNGAASLADALQMNTTLTELDLTNNEIGDDGFKKVLNALEKNKNSALISLGSFQNLAKDVTIIQKIDQYCDNNKTRLSK